MNSTSENALELGIWKAIASREMSASHDHWHLDMVLSYARQLQAIYGGDSDVITASVLMHDLGRNDPNNLHGEDSRRSSIVQAHEIMAGLALSEEKKAKIERAILEHDQTDLSSTLIEARILKDADFLAGFGAWGILRIAMWAGETGGGVNQIFDRLDHRMLKRVRGLEFEESRKLAYKETTFAGLFNALLKQPSSLPTQRKGRYIVLEGISGSGKDTQAKRLQDRLMSEGYSVCVVREPADAYREFRDAWQVQHGKTLDDPVVMRHLLTADRYELISKTVAPALERGDIVISIRSFISTLVYQCHNEREEAIVAFEHEFVPTPDLIILYDTPADLAIQRIETREKHGMYEKPDLLEQHRQKYLRICNSGKYALTDVTITTTREIEEVTEITWQSIRELFEITKPSH